MVRIVVIDDDPFVRMLIRQILERQGYEVTIAASGEEGLERCLEEQAHLVITDIVMPNGDGWDFISRLRQQVKSVRIIAISGGESASSYSYLMLAKRFGAEQVLTKPIAKDTLLAAVSEVLTQRRAS